MSKNKSKMIKIYALRFKQRPVVSSVCFNNKVKLFALMAADTATGKMNQKLKEPKIIEIKENDNEAPVFFGQATRQAQVDMSCGGEIPRNTVCVETSDNAGGWEERTGKIEHVGVSPEGSEGTEVDL